MTLKPPDQTFVHSPTDLYTLWCDLMGDGGFAQRSLWMIFLEGDGRMSPVVVPIDDLPEEPDEQLTGNLAWILHETIEAPLRTAAFLLSRPGPRAMLAGDRHWARALRDAVSPDLVPWPIHLATIDRVQVFAPDDLIAA